VLSPGVAAIEARPLRFHRRLAITLASFPTRRASPPIPSTSHDKKDANPCRVNDRARARYSLKTSTSRWTLINSSP
jgi:hypothetical protein